jgi:putative tricarboxylic transport membrane protein
MSGFIEGLVIVTSNFEFILLIAAGVFVGIYVGAIPGLSGTMAISLLISFTFGWDVMPALVVMVGIYSGTVFGGSRSAILLNIPGSPAAMATALDGYPLAQMGEGGKAMGLAVTESVIGEFFGIAVLIFAAPFIAKIAIKFTPQDYFLLGMMGVILVGSLSQGSFRKALIVAFLGIIVGSIGIDVFTSQIRLTFGSRIMKAGIGFIPVMIGMFGLSEALMQLKTNEKAVKQDVSKIMPEFKLVLKNLPLTIRCSVIGTIIGALPGTGGDIASLIAYDHAKRTVKNPSRPFGEGAYEGVIAPEAANNSAIGGAFIPMMTLGIPGDAATALLLGALLIHGVIPGPLLMMQQPEYFWIFVASLLISNIFLFIFGFTGIKLFAKIVEIPKAILIPIIIVLSLVGSYAINNSIIDVYWMIAFGIIGYLFKINKYPTAPMILGIILSPIIELNLRRGIDLAHDSLLGFFIKMVTSPISLVLLLFIVIMLLQNSKVWSNVKEKIRMN